MSGQTGQSGKGFRENQSHGLSIFHPFLGTVTGFPGGSVSIYGHKKKFSTSLCFYIGTSYFITMKKRQPRRIYSLGLVKASSAFLETQLGRHTLLYKLTRKVTICLQGSTNSKLISSCACFTCRIRILIKHNEPSLQEISTNINY